MLKNIQKLITKRIGLKSEIAFWDRWFKYQGVTDQEKTEKRHRDYLHRLDTQSEFQNKFRELIDLPPNSIIRILDVGAGPLSIIGKCWDERDLVITPVDLLAKHYDKLLKKYKITPPVRTISGSAEYLTNYFKNNYFDLVYARNCIDHVNNPIQAIQEMIAVVKPNCYVLMEHIINEGVSQQYRGLHKWNIFIKNENFFIGNEKSETNISREFNYQVEVNWELESKSNWITTTLKKRKLPNEYITNLP